MARQKREPFASKVLCVLLLACVCATLNFCCAWSDCETLPRDEWFILKTIGAMTLGYFLVYALALLCLTIFRHRRANKTN